MYIARLLFIQLYCNISGSLQHFRHESIFNYSLADGSFEKYNKNHTIPRFLEENLDNLTALFSNYSEHNVSTLNETCWNDWENKQDDACLLAIARTHDIVQGTLVHNNTKTQHERYEKLRTFL